MQIVFGCDHNGESQKIILKAALSQIGEVIDVTYVYPGPSRRKRAALGPLSDQNGTLISDFFKMGR